MKFYLRALSILLLSLTLVLSAMVAAPFVHAAGLNKASVVVAFDEVDVWSRTAETDDTPTPVEKATAGVAEATETPIPEVTEAPPLMVTEAPTFEITAPPPVEPPAEDEDLLTVTDADFQQVISGPDPVLIFFWASWCGPCRRMASDIEQLAHGLAGQVVVGTLDVDENPKTPASLAVKSIPTLLFFKDGELVERFVGVQSRAALQQRLEAQLEARHPTAETPVEPSVEDDELRTVTDANFQAAISGPTPVLIFFWAPWCGPCKQMAPEIEQLAHALKGKAVVGTLDVDENPDAAATFAVEQIPTFLIFKDRELVERFTGIQSRAAFQQYLEQQLDPSHETTKTPVELPEENDEPLVLTDANFQAVISRPDPVLVFFWASWCGPCRRMAPVLEEIANELGDHLVIGTLDVDANEETVSLFGDMRIPMLLLFKDGEAIDRMVGFQTKSQLIKRLAPQVNPAE